MKRFEVENSLGMFLGFLLFFAVMKGLGLYTNVNLRILNIFIHGAFVYSAMQTYRQSVQEPFSYLNTFAVGLRTSFLPVVGFAVFQFIYLTFIDPQFMAYIHENALLGNMLTPFRASIFLVAEGAGVAIFTSYVFMRYFTVQEEVPRVS